MYIPLKSETTLAQGFHIETKCVGVRGFLTRTSLSETVSEPYLPLSASCKI